MSSIVDFIRNLAISAFKKDQLWRISKLEIWEAD